MELKNSFTVPADVDTAWKTLLDVEAIAPCMPGATLESVDGDDFSGNVKVKLGPVSMTYGGQAKFLSKDEATHTAVIEGTGKETRGSGTARANVTTQMVAEGPNLTRVDVTTDLTITGKAAQFGRGVMQDVAGRLVGQFAANLEGVIASRTTGASDVVTQESDGAPVTTQPHTVAAPTQPAEALDLGSVAMGPVLKRAVPVVVGIIAVVAIIWIIASR
jgi:carbon monoxide dehydrogenase subunit G